MAKRSISWFLVLLMLFTAFPASLAEEQHSVEAPSVVEATFGDEPTAEPTATSTVEPTVTPTAEPTATPTAEPTATPTAEPTATPTAEPTATPLAANKAGSLQPPTNVSAVSIAYNAVRITWNVVPDATSYNVWRSTEYSGNYTMVGSSATPNYADYSSLICGRSYYYRVSSRNAGTESGYSTIAAVRVIPAAPTSLKSQQVSPTSAKLTWKAVSGVSGYWVYRMAASATSYDLVGSVSNSASPAFTDTAMVTGTVYYYYVVAYRTVDLNNVASDRSATISAVTLPLPPKTINAKSVSFNTIMVSWSAVSGASSYSLYRSDTHDGSYTPIATNLTVLTYNDINLQTGVNYYYRVVANVGSTQSELSSTAEAYPRPKPITGLSAQSYSEVSARLSWTPSGTEGYSGYAIQITQNLNAWPNKMAKEVSGFNTSSCIYDGLKTGETYYFRARGYTITAGGLKVYSLPTTPVAVVAKPTAPTGFSVKSQDYQTVMMSWNATAGSKGYEVYMGTSSSASTMKKIADVADNGSSSYTYSQSALTCGRNYYFRVIAYTVNATSNIRVYGSAYTATLLAKPVPEHVKNVVVSSSTYNSVTLKWDLVPGTTQYQIWGHPLTSNTYTLLGTVNNGFLTSAKISGLDTGVRMYFRIRAVRSKDGYTGYGPYSGTINHTTVPAIPSLQRTDSYAANTVWLSWSTVDGADGYSIYSSSTSGGGKTLLKNINGGSVKSQTVKATPGLTQYYSVRAWKMVDGKRVYSLFTPERAQGTVPSSPTIQSLIAVNQNKIRINWSCPDDAKGYVSGNYTIYRSTAPGGPYTDIVTITKMDTLTYEDATVSVGQTYYYKMKLRIDTNYGRIVSRFSDYKRVSCLYNAPTNLQAVSTSYDSFILSWDHADYADGYEIYYATSANGNYMLLGGMQTNPSKPSFPAKNLTFGQVYYFKVRAYTKNGLEYSYSNYSASISARTMLEAPTGVIAYSAPNSSARVRWNAVAGAQGYYIYASPAENGTYNYVGTTNKDTTIFTLGNLALGQVIYFKVCAYRIYNAVSFSGEMSVSAKATVKPSEPLALKAQIGGTGQIKLTWTVQRGCEGYTVFRAISGTHNFSIVANYLSNSTSSYTLNNQTLGVKYDYYVAGYAYSNGKQIFANSQTVTITPTLPAPTGLSLRLNGSSSAILSWKPVSGADGYYVQHASSTSGPFTTVGVLRSPSADSFVLAGLVPPGRTLFVRVFAYSLNPDTGKEIGGVKPQAIKCTRK